MFTWLITLDTGETLRLPATDILAVAQQADIIAYGNIVSIVRL